MESSQANTEVLIGQLMRPGVLREQTDSAEPALKEQYAAVKDALKALSDYEYQILYLRHMVGLGHARIAERLDIDEPSVWAFEDRAIRMLRNSLPASRAAIADSPAVMYQREKPAKTKKQPKYTRVFRIDRAAVFAWLDKHPSATLKLISKQFDISESSAINLRKEWQTKNGTKKTSRKHGEPTFVPENYFAWLGDHPHATVAQLAEHGSMSLGTAQRIRDKWRAQREEAPPDIEEPVVLNTPESPTVARFAVTPIAPPASKPISAPAKSTWYEEQIRQARTFCEVLEEQERAAQAYLQTVQQQVKAARSRYEQAVKIAQAQHQMQRGQLVESIGGA